MESTEYDLNVILELVQSTRARSAEYQANLDECRRQSKKLALILIFDFAYPLGRVEVLTGHTRPALRTWVAAEAARRNMPAFKAIKDASEADTPVTDL